MPREFPGLPDALYRNNDDGTFIDVTARAGLGARGRGMGCLAADFDDDGWIDILVANDAEPNTLWRNRHDGTF
jgi:enediyne biosynthesis protein E4